MKPDIPHVDDHVSKLHAVGAMTQQKLQDIRSACEAANIAINVPLPHNCITKGAAPCASAQSTLCDDMCSGVHRNT